MSVTYNITTNFGAKDDLPTNDPDKVVKGKEFTKEFENIKQAFTLAAPTADPVFTGTATFDGFTATAGTVTGTLNVNTELDATLVTANSAAVGTGGLTVLGPFTSVGIDDNATSTAMTIDNNNSVAIGTDRPSVLARLDVVGGGGIRVHNGTSATTGFIENRADSTDLRTVQGNGALTFSTGFSVLGFERMRIDKDGNVGIGTDNPRELLELSSYAPKILMTDTDTSDTFRLSQFNTLSEIAASTDFAISTGGSERLHIDSSGNVGIGEANPDAKLTIKDIATASTNPLDSTHATISLQYSSTKVLNIGDYAASPFASYIQSTNSSGSPFALALNPKGGLVGIGTPSPRAALDVTSTSGEAAVLVDSRATDNEVSRLSLLTKTSGSNTGGVIQHSGGVLSLSNATNLATKHVNIDSSGNVGIGTDSPANNTHIKTGTNAGGITIQRDSVTTNDYAQLGFLASTSDAGTPSAWVRGYRGASSGQEFLTFGTSNDEKMRIDSSGNVGIGVTSTTNGKLCVDGSINITATSGTYAAGALGYTDSNWGFLHRPPRVGAIGAHSFQSFAGDTLMAVTDGGNVGIGNTSPSTEKLAVAIGNSSLDGIVVESLNNGGVTGDHIKATSARGDTSAYNLLKLSNSVGTKLVVQGDGNVGIGTDSPSKNLEVSGPKNAPAIRVSSTTNDSGWSPGDISGALEFYSADNSGPGAGVKGAIRTVAADITGANTQLAFYNASTTVNDVERMRIDSSGNLLVGKTSDADTLGGFVARSSGRVQIHVNNGGTAVTQVGFYNGSGTAAGSISSTGTTTSYNTSSDVRLKENITDADSSGSIIDAIQVRQYDWKADGSHDDYGFVAQELEQVYPKAVTKGETEDDTWGVDYSKLVPMLVKEIQDLKAEVAALKGV